MNGCARLGYAKFRAHPFTLLSLIHSEDRHPRNKRSAINAPTTRALDRSGRAAEEDTLSGYEGKLGEEKSEHARKNARAD